MDRRYALLVRTHLDNHRSEGDADNFVKLYMDALQGIVWKNDRQVDWLTEVKLFGVGSTRTEAEIAIIEPGADLVARATLGGP